MAAHKVLMEFLVEIQVSAGVDWAALSATLVDRASSSQARGAAGPPPPLHGAERRADATPPGLLGSP